LRYLVAVLLITLCGCASEELTPEELRKYVLHEENGLIKSIEINDVKASVIYQPTDLLIYNSYNSTSLGISDSLRMILSSHHYFILNFSRDNSEVLRFLDRESYSALFQTLSFKLGEYVYLNDSDNRMSEIADYMLNATYGTSASTDLLVVFKKKTPEPEWIEFGLKELGLGIGNQKFRFYLTDVNDVPSIKYSSIEQLN
jgi:hypothetical protein